MQSPLCTICHSPSSTQLLVSPCRRCRRQTCLKCCTSLQLYQKISSNKVQLCTVTVCEGCRSEQIQLRLFKQTNKLKFAHSSHIGHRFLKFVSQASAESLATEYRDAQTIRKSRQNEEVYQRLKNKIHEQKLYTKLGLCPSLMELYSMVSADVREQEQHQKVKNLLMVLALNKPLSCVEVIQQDIQNISQMILFFLLFLNEQQTYHIVARLYKNHVPSFIYLNRQEQISELKSDFEDRLSDQFVPILFGVSDAYVTCFRTFTINKLNPQLTFMVLEELFGHKNQLEEYFGRIMVKLVKQCSSENQEDNVYLKMLRIPPFGIKTSKPLNSITTTKLSMMNEEWETSSRQSINFPQKQKPSTTISNQNTLLRKIVQKLALEQDDILNDVRNQYCLIVQLLKKEQQEILLQEERFEREKDDLIERVVRLNNEVEELKGEVQRVRREKEEGERTWEEAIRRLEGKVESLLKVGNKEQGEKGDQNKQMLVYLTQKSLLLSLSSQLCSSLSSISSLSLPLSLSLPPILSPSSLPSFQSSFLSQLTSLILSLISQIDTLTLSQSQLKRIIHTNQKSNKLELETKKLLQILKKKEQRFVEEMLEKDRIIEGYQSVLWHLENGMEGMLGQGNGVGERVARIMEGREKEREREREREIGEGKGKHKGKEKEKGRDKEKEKDCLLF